MQQWKGLMADDGSAIPLKSISMDGVAQGLFFRLKTIQRYRNTGKEAIEAVYTFPISWNAAVTEFAVTIGGERLVAQAMKKSSAEKRYEEALSEGDTPIMLEYSADEGVCTANLGNIPPGEEVAVEISTAEMLSWQNGTVRITLPLVIGDRYSPDGGQGSLLPHQRTQASVFAEYPVKAAVRLRGELAHAEVFAGNAPAKVFPAADETRVSFDKAFADRNLVIALSKVPSVRKALFAKDAISGKWMGCAYACTPSSGKRQPVSVKVLVDCSGSMSGVRIQQARSALAALTETLADRDSVSLTCFGSDVRPEIASLSPFTAALKRRDWMPALSKLDADLGGTNLFEALESVVKQDKGQPADILLITDGDVWDSRDISRLLKEARHRLFAIGVGLAPGENLLRRMAESSGGFTQMVLPSEDMDSVADRMIELIGSESSPSPEKRQGHIWESGTASQPVSFSGQSQLTLGTLYCDPALTNGLEETLGAVTLLDDCQPLCQLVANARIRECDNEEQRVQIAESYGIVSGETSLILVKQRAEAEKGDGAPVLAQVPQMAVADTLAARCVTHFDMSISAPGCCSSVMSDAVCDDVCESHRCESRQGGSLTRNVMAHLPAFLRRSRQKAQIASSCEDLCSPIQQTPAEPLWKQLPEADRIELFANAIEQAATQPALSVAGIEQILSLLPSYVRQTINLNVPGIDPLATARHILACIIRILRDCYGFQFDSKAVKAFKRKNQLQHADKLDDLCARLIASFPIASDLED